MGQIIISGATCCCHQSGCLCCDNGTYCNDMLLTVSGVVNTAGCSNCTDFNDNYNIFAGGTPGFSDVECSWDITSRITEPCNRAGLGPNSYEILCGDFEFSEFDEENGTFGPPILTGGLLTEMGVFEETTGGLDILIGQWQCFNGAPTAPSGETPYFTVDCCAPTICDWQDIDTGDHVDLCNWSSATVVITGLCNNCT